METDGDTLTPSGLKKKFMHVIKHSAVTPFLFLHWLKCKSWSNLELRHGWESTAQSFMESASQSCAVTQRGHLYILYILCAYVRVYLPELELISCNTSGLRVTIPEPLGKKSLGKKNRQSHFNHTHPWNRARKDSILRQGQAMCQGCGETVNPTSLTAYFRHTYYSPDSIYRTGCKVVLQCTVYIWCVFSH